MVRARSFSNGARLAAVFFLLLWRVDAHAQAGPMLPCGIDAAPNYPDLHAPPAEKYWLNADVDKQWKFPSCLGWTKPGFSTLVTSVGRFQYAGGAEGLLRRFGAISELSGVRYWSASRGQWATLILDATAYTNAGGKSRRADFTLEEMQLGQDLYFDQADNLFGKAIYRMRVTEFTPDRVVVTVENANAMRYVILTLAAPGDMQTVYFFDRESADVWRFYSIFRTGPHASSLLAGKPASSINRAVAFYRHYAGIQTDLEPPMARDPRMAQ